MTQPTPTPERADTVVVRKLIHAPRERVFRAWTDAEGMKQWMCPRKDFTVEAQLDVRVGGSYRILMHGTERDYDHTGEYKVVEPPSKLVFTWISDGTDDQATLVTIELFERGKDTEIILTHERFPNLEAVTSHTRGWTEIIGRLAELFA